MVLMNSSYARYANCLSAVMRTVLFYEKDLSAVADDSSLRELLVRSYADRPFLRKGLTYSIRPPVPLCNPVLPYPVHVLLRSIPLIPAQSIHLIQYRMLVA